MKNDFYGSVPTVGIQIHCKIFFSPFFNLHTCDKFKKGIREVFFSFQGGFSKLYRMYRKIYNSVQGDFLIL